MNNINVVVFGGVLTENPKHGVTKNGKNQVQLNIYNESTQGQFVKKTYMTVTGYGRCVDACKGVGRDSPVTVRGALTSWKSENGKWNIGITADDIFIDGSGKNSTWADVASEDDPNAPPF